MQIKLPIRVILIILEYKLPLGKLLLVYLYYSRQINSPHNM